MASRSRRGRCVAGIGLGTMLAFAAGADRARGQEGGAVAREAEVLSVPAPPGLADAAAVQRWANRELHRLLGLERTDRLLVEPEPARLGRGTVFTLRQFAGGLPVINRESRLVAADDRPEARLLGRHDPFLGLPRSEPRLGLAAAIRASGSPAQRVLGQRLVFWPAGSDLVLAYEVEGAFANPSGARFERVYLDARSGRVIERLPMEFTAVDRRIYDFEDACRGYGRGRPLDIGDSTRLVMRAISGHLGRSESTGRSSRAPVNAVFDLFGEFHGYLRTTLQMDSFDGRGGTLQGLVGVKFHNPYTWPQCDGDQFNAVWYSGQRLLAVTDEGSKFPEVIGHELGHGIVESGSGLIGRDEPGALGESISDVLGAGFRAWLETRGRLDLDIPDEIWRLRSPAGPLRDLQNPRRVGRMPNHYSDYRWMHEDHGGVHVNSSIMNQGLYLLAAGGRHPDRRSGPAVVGIGMAKALEIVGRAAVHLLTPNSSFGDARFGFALAAELLHGEGSREWVSTHQAMDAVGVPGTWVLPAAPDPDGISDPEEGETVSRSGGGRGASAPPRDPVAGGGAPPTVPGPAPPHAEPPEDSPGGPGRPPGDSRASAWIGAALALLVVAALAGWALSSPMQARRRASASPPPVPAPVNRQGPALVPIGRAAPAVAAALVPLDGSGRIPLDPRLLMSPEGLVVGRGRNRCDVSLRDLNVSRRHLRLRLENGAIWIEDLDSTCGTRLGALDAEPYRPLRAGSGDVVRIGKSAYRLDLGSA